jgi:hypothetical protein
LIQNALAGEDLLIASVFNRNRFNTTTGDHFNDDLMLTINITGDRIYAVLTNINLSTISRDI